MQWLVIDCDARGVPTAGAPGGAPLVTVQQTFVDVSLPVVGGGHPSNTWIGSSYSIQGTSHSVGTPPCSQLPPPLHDHPDLFASEPQSRLSSCSCIFSEAGPRGAAKGCVWRAACLFGNRPHRSQGRVREGPVCLKPEGRVGCQSLGDPRVGRWMNQGGWEQSPFHPFAEKKCLE